MVMLPRPSPGLGILGAGEELRLGRLIAESQRLGQFGDAFVETGDRHSAVSINQSSEHLAKCIGGVGHAAAEYA
jgi:hypothetical protein